MRGHLQTASLEDLDNGDIVEFEYSHCHHSILVRPIALRALRGKQFIPDNTKILDIRLRWRCTACGSRDPDNRTEYWASPARIPLAGSAAGEKGSRQCVTSIRSPRARQPSARLRARCAATSATCRHYLASSPTIRRRSSETPRKAASLPACSEPSTFLNLSSKPRWSFHQATRRCHCSRRSSCPTE